MSDAEKKSSKGSRPEPPTAPSDIFAARAGGIAAAIGRRLGSRRQAIAALVVWAIAFLALGALIIGLGLLLTHVLLPAGLSQDETGVSRWFAGERTPSLNDVTRFASDMGSTFVVIGIAVVTAVALAIRKHWRQIVFLVCALTLEVGLFLLTSVVIGRHRPGVHQLDAAPPTSSYPSGHMASAMTLYVGLAIVAYSILRRRSTRVLVGVPAVLLPIAVGISRLYRGMHFPTDVAASVLLSAGALIFALLAVRSMAAAGAERERRAAAPAPPPAQQRTPVRPPPEVTS